MSFVTILVRALICVVLGALIGSERAKSGRAAGMRTHILVCIGAALTSMISIYAAQRLGNSGDMLRLSAQVISGIGFLGAGMIILKDNNSISGLTTAAGIWTTSVIGIAVGFGFYIGAFIVTALYLLAIIFLAKLRKAKNNTETIYVEISDMTKANAIVDQITEMINSEILHTFVAAKSGNTTHLGIILSIQRQLKFDINQLLEISDVIYVEEE